MVSQIKNLGVCIIGNILEILSILLLLIIIYIGHKLWQFGVGNIVLSALLAVNTNRLQNVNDKTLLALGIAVQVIISIILLLTVLFAWRGQKKNFAADLSRNRYDTFYESWDVTDEDVRQFKSKPHLYVDDDAVDNHTYEEWKRDDNKIRDFLIIVQLYEYLAFAHASTCSKKYLGRWRIGKYWEWMRKNIDLNYFDPYDEQWIKRWIDLLRRDPYFKYVHGSYKYDHPEFHAYVEKEIERNKPPDVIVRCPEKYSSLRESIKFDASGKPIPRLPE